MSPSIAGIVLTLNEERDLGASLISLSFCNELIVVDSGSTDSTQDIAHKHGALFLTHIQTAPFSITDQRNWILNTGIIKSEWVLFLDADEIIGVALKDEIIRVIADPGGISAFMLTPRYWFLGKWLKRTQGYPNWHPRLLTNGSVRFEGGVWESFHSGTNVGKIFIPYEHYAFSKGLDDWLVRHQRYASFDAHQIYQLNKHNKSHYIKTQRWRRIRLISARVWMLMPILRFIQKYILNLGFIEGWQALLFSLMMSFYDLMVLIKVIEYRRREEGLKL